MGVTAIFGAAVAAGDLRAVNAAFLAHLDELGPQYAISAAACRQAWRDSYADNAPVDFVADSLSRLYPAVGEAMAAFDSGRLDEATRLFGALRSHKDRFVAANATYFQVRAVLGQSLTEEADELFATLSDDASRELMSSYSPYADRMIVLQAASEARTLQFDAAQETLALLEGADGAVSDLVGISADQLRIELQAREKGTLGEVATYMDYSGERLTIADASMRLQSRQQKILDLLDQLIEDQQQQEQQQGGSGAPQQGQPQGDQSRSPDAPTDPADESRIREGQGEIGDLHAAPRANPGEMWGKMPPAERDRVLQSIRERYPSRYRQIVEQFYRSMAEQKE
ncbi:MAG: hypothetical protein KDA32_03220 [Phycisphaerales bacterium]|nr:hypothetical protein [Phycisphaerales bacterium]